MPKPKSSDPLTLLQKQRLFCYLVAELITWCYDHGYELSFGEAYRTPEQAARNAATGAGIANSLHTKRLAIDLNLFTVLPSGESEYKTQTEDYAELGTYWKSLHPLCKWGGDFKSRKDGNHFSLEHEGVK